ncbi:PREDICTED: uncharacterized protein LOC107186881 [Dufourea novaeangliae]|uniref:uncharacterized protein LOC107186881 n=1 Tax=Dufourea novaeangliae TaxID=178035 RepID=UPI0007671724|nr:PREDICTED: uncharacterized protein LOC107186881 [Dufourea novaeangliae]XP_015430334.1 PREDICTED: uncharacterized protein LOC107186881 [Dufourea novaeangliae]XP_015430342.1 PREDICTED: uncharacterized protein LOC107186881 [Dufourea novaeangliae]
MANMASSPTGGVKAINIEGRMARERKRLLGMTDEERAWRAKFLKSQIIPPGEPIETPEYYKEYYNPLKRLIRIPLNLMENSLAPIMGKRNALVTRTVTSKLIIGIVGIYCTWYYAKYNTAVWYRKSGWYVMKVRHAQLPGEEGYPGPTVKKPNEYASRGFENSPI